MALLLVVPLLMALLFAPETLRWRDLGYSCLALAVVFFPYLLWELVTKFSDITIIRSILEAQTCLGNNAYLETPLCYYTPEFSVLWHPFVVYQPLNHKQVLYLLYSLFVGVYLLVPLLITTGRQLTAAAREFCRVRLDLRLWRI